MASCEPDVTVSPPFGLFTFTVGAVVSATRGTPTNSVIPAKLPPTLGDVKNLAGAPNVPPPLSLMAATPASVTLVPVALGVKKERNASPSAKSI